MVKYGALPQCPWLYLFCNHTFDFKQYLVQVKFNKELWQQPRRTLTPYGITAFS